MQIRPFFDIEDLENPVEHHAGYTQSENIYLL